MKKFIYEVIENTCEHCPYIMCDDEWDSYTCKLTGHIVTNERRLYRKGWPPIPDFCPLPEEEHEIEDFIEPDHSPISESE